MILHAIRKSAALRPPSLHNYFIISHGKYTGQRDQCEKPSTLERSGVKLTNKEVLAVYYAVINKKGIWEHEGNVENRSRR